MSPHRPENDETLETLAHRLRRLPPPPVPPGLEARLLAAVPRAPRARGGLLRFRIAAAVLLAAAASVFFAVRPHTDVSTPTVTTPRPADDAPTLWRFQQALRRSDADPSVVLNQTMPPFEWPVAGPVLRSDRLAESLQE